MRRVRGIGHWWMMILEVILVAGDFMRASSSSVDCLHLCDREPAFYLITSTAWLSTTSKTNIFNQQLLLSRQNDWRDKLNSAEAWRPPSNSCSIDFANYVRGNTTLKIFADFYQPFTYQAREVFFLTCPARFLSMGNRKSNSSRPPAARPPVSP